MLSLTAAQQLIAAATLGQPVAGGGRGLLFPNLLPVSQQSNFIPVVDSNGVPQLMASSATHCPSLSTQGVPPIVFLGPGNIPFLPAAQPSMYLVNPSTDLSSLQHPQQPSPPPSMQPTLSGITTQPSYIVLPQQSFHMPQSLTLEQLQALSTSYLQQRQEQLPQSIDIRRLEPARQMMNNSGSVSSRPSIDSNHSTDGDEVEEHFARALGDKYKKVLKGSSSSPNKVST